MATKKILSDIQVDGSISSEGGSYTSGVDTKNDVGLVIKKGDRIYSDDGSYLRYIISHKSDDDIEIGQASTGLIRDILIRPGTTGNIKFFGSGSEDVTINSSGNLIANGSITANSLIKDGGTSSEFLKADGSVDSNTYLTSAAIGGFIDGSGSAGAIPKFTDSDTVEDSIITEDSGKIGIDIASPKAALHVNGAVIIGNDTSTASADLAGALRYWDETDGGEITSYVDMCMKSGCGYSWINIVTNRTACL